MITKKLRSSLLNPIGTNRNQSMKKSNKFKTSHLDLLKLNNILMFEAFDLDKFLEDPDANMHDDSNDTIDVGTYVSTYRGPGQVVDEDRNFWVVKLLSEDGKEVKVPKEECTKMTMAEVEDYRESVSNLDIDAELETIKNDLSSSIENFVEEVSPENYIYKGNISKGLSFLDEIITDVLRLKMKDPDLIVRDDVWVISQLIAVGLNAIETASGDPEIKKRVDVMWDQIRNL